MSNRLWLWRGVLPKRALNGQELAGTYELASMSRILQHVKNKNVGTMSASRGNLSEAENRKRNKEMKALIRKAGFGYIPIRGRYIENIGTNKEQAVDEDVVFITSDATEEAKGKLKHLMVQLGKKYRQDTILFKPFDSDEAKLVHTYGNKKGREINIGKFRADEIGEFFSRTKGGKHSFVFRHGQDDKKEDLAEQKALKEKQAEKNKKKLQEEERRKANIKEKQSRVFRKAESEKNKNQTKKLSVDEKDEWFYNMNKAAQQRYVKKHPNSKYAKQYKTMAFLRKLKKKI